MASNALTYSDREKMSFDHGIVHPAYSGVSLLLSWIYLLFYANSAGIEAAAPISLMGTPYTLSSACMSLAVLVIAFGPASLADAIMNARMKVTAPLLTSVGTTLMILGGMVELFWLVIIGSLVTGIFSGIMAQQWVVAYKRVGLKTVICSFPALLALAVGVCMTLMYLPREYVLVATIVLPLVSGLMLHSVRRFLYPVYEIDANIANRPFDFVLLVFPVSVFAFSSGFLDYFSSESGYTFFFYVVVSAVLLLTACVFILVSNKSNVFVCLILPLCFLVSEFVPFLIMIDSVPAAHFISIGELGIEIALFSVAVGFAEFFFLSPLKTYALCRVAHTLLNAIGWYASEFSSNSFSELMNSQASLAVVFVGIEVISIFLIVAIVKSQKVLPADTAMASSTSAGAGADVAGRARPFREEPANRADRKTLGVSPAERKGNAEAPGVAKGASPKADAPASSPRETDMSCAELGRTHSLSNREMDVFRLLAKGYTSAGIQSELYIAAGTVNYHARNIYAKLGVHSKQELISLVSHHRESQG